MGAAGPTRLTQRFESLLSPERSYLVAPSRKVAFSSHNSHTCLSSLPEKLLATDSLVSYAFLITLHCLAVVTDTPGNTGH